MPYIGSNAIWTSTFISSVLEVVLTNAVTFDDR